MINHTFLIFLEKLIPVEPYLELSREIVQDLYYGFHNDNNAEQKRIRLNAGKLVDKIVNARDLFTRADIDYDDYLTIETNCKNKLNNCIKELHLLAVIYSQLRVTIIKLQWYCITFLIFKANPIH